MRVVVHADREQGSLFPLDFHALRGKSSTLTQNDVCSEKFYSRSLLYPLARATYAKEISTHRVRALHYCARQTTLRILPLITVENFIMQ